MSNRFRAAGITASSLILIGLSACMTTHPIGDQNILSPNQKVRGSSAQICFYSVKKIQVSEAPANQRLTVVVGNMTGPKRVLQLFAQSFVGTGVWNRGPQTAIRKNNPDIKTNPGKLIGVLVYNEDAKVVGSNTVDRMPYVCGGNGSGKKIMFEAKIDVKYANGIALVTAKADRKY